MRYFYKKLDKCSILIITVLLSWVFAGETQNLFSLNVREVLSVRTGKGTRSIGNQFGGENRVSDLDPFEGFSVDSEGNILIEDRVNRRIQVFSREGAFVRSLGFSPNDPTFSPRTICLDGKDNLYVHNVERDNVFGFSPISGKVLGFYDPGSTVFDNLYRKVPIISLECKGDRIWITYGIERLTTKMNKIQPVHMDELDLDFNLLNRTVIEDDKAYYDRKLREQRSSGFWQVFQDLNGNRYCYPIIPDDPANRKFLPLAKFSRAGTLLYTLDGQWLSKRTKYKVHSYPDIQGWGDYRGNDFLIVNWHVTPDGSIYTLLANKDYVKVLRITG